MKLSKILQNLEDTMAAVAFAEAGEQRNVMEMLQWRKDKEKSSNTSQQASENRLGTIQSVA